MNFRKHITFCALTIVGALSAVSAQTPLTEPNLGIPSLVAPAYFGPNAFAVPDMTDGRLPGLRAEVAADGHFGFAGDKTADIFARVCLPLFTDRASLVIWMPVTEWYENSLARQTQCRLQDSVVMRGHEAGDVYISTDILILKERSKVPGIVLRACLRTASGGSYSKARFYDSPGYFFDLSVGKGFEWDNGWNVRVAGSAGFLCWQTDNGRQNDAVMYGLQAQTGWKYLSLKTMWSGYAGWEKQGDRPMVIRATLTGHIPVKGCIGMIEPFAAYQYGIKDQPWHSVRLGVAWEADFASLSERLQAKKQAKTVK